MFSIALTVLYSAAGASEDVVVRASGTQTVGDLAARLAHRLGHGADRSRQTLHVRRSGQTLAPDKRLADVDLVDGDVLALIDWVGPTDDRQGFEVPTTRSATARANSRGSSVCPAADARACSVCQAVVTVVSNPGQFELCLKDVDPRARLAKRLA